MKTYFLNEDEGLVLSSGHTYAFACIEFNNGIKTKPKNAEGAKILIVLEGEMDCIIDNKSFRLTENSWINIPKDKSYGVNVYRSLKPCKFVILTCLQGSIENKISTGDMTKLPLNNKGFDYALFGQESEVMQGVYLKLKKEEILSDNTDNEGFLLVLKGKVKIKYLFNEGEVQKNSFIYIPKHRKFTVEALSDEVTAILVTSPVNGGKLFEYTDYLRKHYGIHWDEGALDV